MASRSLSRIAVKEGGRGDLGKCVAYVFWKARKMSMAISR